MDAEYLYFFFTVSLWCVIALSVAYLLIMSLAMRDFDFITSQPLTFFAEIVLVCVLPALSLVFLCFTRGVSLARGFIVAGSFAGFLVLFHVLLQTSGYYTNVFVPSLV